MTTRRQSPENRAFRQEAFASSSEIERGILGNLVAARCAKLTDREEIALIWWLQQVSWREGGLTAFAREFLAANKARIGTASMHKFGTKPGQVYGFEQAKEIRSEIPLNSRTYEEQFPLRGDEVPVGMADLICESLGREPPSRRDYSSAPTSYSLEDFLDVCALTAETLTEILQSTLVDPSRKCLQSGLWNFPSLREALIEWRQREIDTARDGFVETDIASTAFEELDFALETKSFVLIEGREGIGKSEAAKNWVARHPGRAIYVRFESGADETSMFRSIARAVGTACSYSRKTAEMRGRLQDALQVGHLMLVIDEAHFLFPQSHRSFRSSPKRLDWLRTALVDFNVPVALISTPQFFATALERHRVAGWNSNQVARRLPPAKVLPETPSQESVIAVTRHYFPNVTTKEAKLIAGAALTSIGFLTTIVHLRKRVDFLKSRHPETSEAAHLQAALGAYLRPAEPAKTPSQGKLAKVPEAATNGRCIPVATPVHSRLKQPDFRTTNPLEEPSLTIN